MNRSVCQVATLFLIGCLVALCFTHPVPAKADGPVVRVVLFFSPTCPHCHQVMTETLPPLMEHYGNQLQIVSVNTSHPDGQALYQAAIERYAIPEERRGVPTLIIGATAG